MSACSVGRALGPASHLSLDVDLPLIVGCGPNARRVLDDGPEELEGVVLRQNVRVCTFGGPGDAVRRELLRRPKVYVTVDDGLRRGTATRSRRQRGEGRRRKFGWNSLGRHWLWEWRDEKRSRAKHAEPRERSAATLVSTTTRRFSVLDDGTQKWDKQAGKTRYNSVSYQMSSIPEIVTFCPGSNAGIPALKRLSTVDQHFSIFPSK